MRKINICFSWALMAMFTITCVFSCKRLVEVSSPGTSNTGQSVYTTDATAISAVTALYADISANSTISPGSIQSLSLYGELSADEYMLDPSVTDQTKIAYYQNNLNGTTSGFGSEYWSTIYPYIFICNSAIEGLGTSNSLTPAVKQQLLGEAKFMRAFFYFYLVNLYGDLPLTLSSNYKDNNALARSTKQEVYQQIIADLKDAQNLLSPNYLDGTLLNTSPDRVRPNQGTATALLARVYLYTSDWANAEAQSTAVINNSGVYSLSSLDTAFLRSSLGNNEAIWQLQPVNTGYNTEDAFAFVVPATGPNTGDQAGAVLSPFLLNSFEPGDLRDSEWVGNIDVSGTTYYFPYKYKVNVLTTTDPITEYMMMLRLGEQYLIRAEARAQQNNLVGAIDDLNVIRSRAGLAGTTATSQAGLLTAILHERQVELFSELGQRWLDLKRTGTVDAVMGAGGVCAAKGGTWKTNQQLYPLPLADLQNDLNLVQNTGY